MGFSHPGGDLTLCILHALSIRLWHMQEKNGEDSSSLWLDLSKIAAGNLRVSGNGGKQARTTCFSPGREKNSAPDLMLGCILHLHLWLALLTWDLLSSVYHSVTSTWGLWIYMSMISYNHDAQAFLLVHGSQSLSDQEGSAGEKWHWDICTSHFVLLLSTTHCLMQLAVWISTMTCNVDFFRDLNRIGQLSV